MKDSNSLQNIMLTVAFQSIILSMSFPNLRHTTWSFIKIFKNISFDTCTTISSNMAWTTRQQEFPINYLIRTPRPCTFCFNKNHRRRYSKMFSMFFWGETFYISSYIWVRSRYSRWTWSTRNLNFNRPNWVPSRQINSSSQRNSN